MPYRDQNMSQLDGNYGAVLLAYLPRLGHQITNATNASLGPA